MRTLFNAELSQLEDDLVEMSAHVLSAIERSTKALLTKDVELAQQVIADDAELDRLEARVDERAILLIAQQQPVGVDLRTIVTSLRISSALERMGDLAEHVAEHARRAYPESAVAESHMDVIGKMCEAAVDTSAQLVELIKKRDLNLAAQLASEDDQLDQLHDEAYAALVSGDFSGSQQDALDIALLARYLERFGDHAVNIGRRVVYLVTGDVSEYSTTIHD